MWDSQANRLYCDICIQILSTNENMQDTNETLNLLDDYLHNEPKLKKISPDTPIHIQKKPSKLEYY